MSGSLRFSRPSKPCRQKKATPTRRKKNRFLEMKEGRPLEGGLRIVTPQSGSTGTTTHQDAEGIRMRGPRQRRDTKWSQEPLTAGSDNETLDHLLPLS